MRGFAVTLALLIATGASALTVEERLEMLWARAERQIDFEKFDDALASGRRAVQIAPPSASAHALHAYTLFVHPGRDAAEAMQAVERALTLDPGSARGHYVAGLVTPWVTDPPDYEAAIAHLRRAAEADPEMADALSMLGLALLDSGRSTEALEPLRRAVEIEPQYHEWRLNLAEGLMAAGRVQEALEQSREAIALAPPGPAEALAHNNLAWQTCLARYVDAFLAWRAVESARRAVALRPDEPFYQDTLGTTLALFGRPREALAPLRAALELGHRSEPALAWALARLGRANEARSVLAEVSEFLVSDDARPHHLFLAGQAWAALDEETIARRIFERATERWPHHPWADDMRAWLETRRAQ